MGEHDRNELHAIRTQPQHAVRRYRHRLVRERRLYLRRRPAGRRHAGAHGPGRGAGHGPGRGDGDRLPLRDREEPGAKAQRQRRGRCDHRRGRGQVPRQERGRCAAARAWRGHQPRRRRREERQRAGPVLGAGADRIERQLHRHRRVQRRPDALVQLHVAAIEPAGQRRAVQDPGSAHRRRRHRRHGDPADAAPAGTGATFRLRLGRGHLVGYQQEDRRPVLRLLLVARQGQPLRCLRWLHAAEAHRAHAQCQYRELAVVRPRRRRPGGRREWKSVGLQRQLVGRHRFLEPGRQLLHRFHDADGGQPGGQTRGARAQGRATDLAVQAHRRPDPDRQLLPLRPVAGLADQHHQDSRVEHRALLRRRQLARRPSARRAAVRSQRHDRHWRCL